MILLQLFISFAQVGLLSFGGGYAALPLIQSQIVEKMGWLSSAEFTDIVTISQMTPGPIILNAATFVGFRMAGVPGAVAATIGSITPSVIIVLLLAILYKKYKKLPVVQDVLAGIQPAVMALISVAAVGMIDSSLGGELGLVASGITGISWYAVVLFLLMIIVLRKTKWDSTVALLVFGVAGGIAYYFLEPLGIR